MKSQPIVVSTDASVNPQFGVGGWAFWLQGKDLEVKRSGTIRAGTRDSTEAELMCIVNGLTIVHKLKDLRTCQVIINTDSLAAIRMLTGGSYNAVYAQYVAHIERLLGLTQKYHFLHIKAHKKGSEISKLELLNRWCDRHARRNMNKALKEVKAREETARKNRPVHRKKPRYPNKFRQVVTDRRMGKRGIVPYKRAKGNFSSELHDS